MNKKNMRTNNYPRHGLRGKLYQQTYETMLLQQNELCLICHRHQDDAPKKFCIDHCHETGKIRGLLCDPCNISLGYVENFGCEAFHTIIPIESLYGTRYQISNPQEYKDLHERIERWMKRHKEAVALYLGLNLS